MKNSLSITVVGLSLTVLFAAFVPAYNYFQRHFASTPAPATRAGQPLPVRP